MRWALAANPPTSGSASLQCVSGANQSAGGSAHGDSTFLRAGTKYRRRKPPNEGAMNHTPMTASEIVDACKATTLFTWSAQAGLDPLPIARAQGVWMWDVRGQKILDFNSQAMSVHIGHGHPKVIEAMRQQAEQLVYVSASFATEVRARLGLQLARIMPGALNTSLFTLGGAESNEHAVRIARAVTGRQKILTRYRSYHGSTNLTLSMTGDHRRWANEPGPPGFVRVMDPQPYGYSGFGFGKTPQEIADNHLAYLDETLMYEGPHAIAAMIIETIPGTNGVLLPPTTDYLPRLQAMLHKHGILLVCDEVMSGFGRTGKWFAFEHSGIQPDMITLAKGLSSSYLPLGSVGLSDAVRSHFDKNILWGGHTYNSHPMCLAAALANLEVIEEEKLVDKAAALEPVMKACMAELKRKHPCVKDVRAIGLFGMVELQKNARGEPFGPYAGSSPTMTKLGKHFRERGLFTFLKHSNFTCIPPLCISEAELRYGFDIVDSGLSLVDQDFEA
jgi:taurine---2-oxoglutarate transaminase